MYSREEAIRLRNKAKKFVRYKEGAEMYSMCQKKFESMAKDAKAIYKLDKLVLVNCDIFEEYLESFRLLGQEIQYLTFCYTKSIIYLCAGGI